MAYKSQSIEDGYSLDFFKLECYCNRINLSLSSLSTAIGKSRNWLSELKRAEKAKAKPSIIDLSDALLIANQLDCTIEDIRSYSAIYRVKDLDPLASSKLEAHVKELTEKLLQSEQPLPAEFDGQVDLLIKQTVSYQKNDFITPFTFDYEQLFSDVIQNMSDSNKTILALFLLHMWRADEDEQKDLKFLLLSSLVYPMCSSKDGFAIKYGKDWWINLFLLRLRDEIFKANLTPHIPTETELRRIYNSHLERDSNGRITDQSFQNAKKALATSLKTAIDRILDAVFEDASTSVNIVQMCAEYLANYFRHPEHLVAEQIILFKEGHF